MFNKIKKDKFPHSVWIVWENNDTYVFNSRKEAREWIKSIGEQIGVFSKPVKFCRDY